MSFCCFALNVICLVFGPCLAWFVNLCFAFSKNFNSHSNLAIGNKFYSSLGVSYLFKSWPPLTNNEMMLKKSQELGLNASAKTRTKLLSNN